MPRAPPARKHSARSRLRPAASLQSLVRTVSFARPAPASAFTPATATATAHPAPARELDCRPVVGATSSPASSDGPARTRRTLATLDNALSSRSSTDPAAPAAMRTPSATSWHRASASASSGAAAPSSEAPEEEERLRTLAGRSAPAMFAATRTHAKRGSGPASSLAREAQSDPEGRRRHLQSTTDVLSSRKFPPSPTPDPLDPAEAANRGVGGNGFHALSDRGTGRTRLKGKGGFPSNPSLLHLLGKSTETRQEPRPFKKSFWSSARLRTLSGNFFRSKKAPQSQPMTPSSDAQDRQKTSTFHARPEGDASRSSASQASAVPQRNATPRPSPALPPPASPATSSGRSSLSLRSMLEGSRLETLRSWSGSHGTTSGKQEPNARSSEAQWEQAIQGTPPRPEEGTEQQELLANSSPSIPSTPAGWRLPKSASIPLLHTWRRDKAANASVSSTQLAESLHREEFGPLDTPASSTLELPAGRVSTSSRLKKQGQRIRRMFSFESPPSSVTGTISQQKDTATTHSAYGSVDAAREQPGSCMDANASTTGQTTPCRERDSSHASESGQGGRLRTFSNLALRGKKRASPMPKTKGNGSATSSTKRVNGSLTAAPTGLRAMSLEMGLIDEANLSDPFRSYHVASPVDTHKALEAEKHTATPTYPPKVGRSPRPGVSPSPSRASLRETHQRTGSPRQSSQKRHSPGPASTLGTGARTLISPPPNLPLPPLPGDPPVQEFPAHLLIPCANGPEKHDDRPAQTERVDVSPSSSSFHSTTDMMPEGSASGRRRISAGSDKHAVLTVTTSEPSTPKQRSATHTVRAPERKVSGSDLSAAQHLRHRKLLDPIVTQSGPEDSAHNAFEAKHCPPSSPCIADREPYKRTNTDRASVLTRASNRRTSAVTLSWKSGSVTSRPTSLTTTSSHSASLGGTQTLGSGPRNGGYRVQSPSGGSKLALVPNSPGPPLTASFVHEQSSWDATSVPTPAFSNASGRASEQDSTKTVKPREGIPQRSPPVEEGPGAGSPLPLKSSELSFDALSPPRPSSALSPLDSAASGFHTPVHTTPAARAISVILSGTAPSGPELVSSVMPITVRAQRWSEQVLRPSISSLSLGEGSKYEPRSAPLLVRASWTNAHGTVPFPATDQNTVEEVAPREHHLTGSLISPRRLKSRSSASTDTNSTHTIVPHSSHTLLRQRSEGSLGPVVGGDTSTTTTSSALSLVPLHADPPPTRTPSP